MPEIIRWFLADPKRTQLWRMLSFQPEADTGRTIFSEQPITPALAWEKICDGVGLPLRRDVSIFGHPDCNSWASLLVSQSTGADLSDCCRTIRNGTASSAEVLDAHRRALARHRRRRHRRRVASLGVLAQNPDLALRLRAYLVRFTSPAEDALRDVPRAACAGKCTPLGVGMHNFMDAAHGRHARTHDPVIKSRLDSCVFKGAVKQDGEWIAVPMCKMNEAKWSEVYQRRLEDPILAGQSQPKPSRDAKSASMEQSAAGSVPLS